MNMHHQELAALQIFHGLEQEDAVSICESLQLSRFKKNQTILNEGECVQSLWIILEGECIVSRECQPGNERTLAVLKPGDVFGEMSFVRTAPHSASIKSSTETAVCAYSREDYLELVARRPQVAWQIASNIAAVLAERLRRMDTWVCELVDSPEGSDHRDEWQVFRSAVYTNWNF